MAHRAGDRPPYWQAARLAATADAHWPSFDGWAAARGVDPLDLPFDRFCNLVYYWLTRSANERRLREIDEFLDRPPPDASPEDDVDEGAWSAEAEMAAFQAAAAAAGSTRR